MNKTVYRIHNQDGSLDVASSVNPTIIKKSFKDVEACQDYIDDLDSICIDVFYGSFVKERFFVDLERKCNLMLQDCIACANSHGWGFRHDVIYRSSAAWKDEPLHYCYFGDFGGSAYFEIDTKDGEIEQSAADLIHTNMSWLQACSVTLCELGFILTFDDSGKHTIMSRCSAYYAEVDHEG